MRPPRTAPAEGLCAVCRHARTVTSAKLSTFVRCALAAGDARFPKYPRLPVTRCDGYQPPTDLPANQDRNT